MPVITMHYFRIGLYVYNPRSQTDAFQGPFGCFKKIEVLVLTYLTSLDYFNVNSVVGTYSETYSSRINEFKTKGRIGATY